MGNFELKVDEVGRWAMICTNHGIEKTREDAEKQGLIAKWKDGKIVIEKPADMVVFEQKKVFPRAGKRPAVIKVRVMQVRCKECGRFEERELLAFAVMGRLECKNG